MFLIFGLTSVVGVSANGDQTTTSIHQYLLWLQQRAQGLNNDGTYSPDMLK